MSIYFHDIKYALRRLATSPGFTAVAVITLAVGIGANMAILSFVYSVLWDPLPVRNSSRWVQIRAYDKESGQYRIGVNPPTIMELRKHKEIFSELGFFENHSITFQGDQFQERVWGNKVSSNFFNMWGIHPQLGRTFAAHEGQPGKDNVVVLSHGYWLSRFRGRNGIIGETIQFNEMNVTVVGVMPPEFQFPYAQLSYWIAGEAPELPQAYGYCDFGLLARMQPGITLKETQALLDTIAARQAQAHSASNQEFGLTVRPLRQMFSTETIQKSLLSLMVAVGFILMIGCANLANLLFARTESRKRELAVRCALGAGTFRLLRQLLMESVLLAVFGGLCGLLVTYWGIEGLSILIPKNMPQLRSIHINFGLLGITFVFSVAVGIAFGLVPAWFACRGKISTALRQKVSAVSPDRSRKRLGNALVVTEVALAVVLLSGAGLMISSVVRLLKVDPGYNPTHLVRVYMGLPWEPYNDLERKNLFLQQLHERWSSLPGVDSVGIGVSYAGQKPERWTDRDGTTYLVRKVGCGLGDENFLRTMGAHLITGRYLEQSDIGEDRRTVVVNETMARRFRLGDNPVGKTITRITDQGPVPYEVVGMVNDLRDYRLNQEIEPIFCRPYQDMPLGRPLFIALRTTVEPTSMYANLRKELKDLEPSIGAPFFEKVENTLYDSTATHRIYMKCLMLSAAVGMGLAALGIYGILAYSVAQRTKEMGIRIALGAHSYDIIRCTVWESVRSVLFGVVVGLIGTFWLSRFIESLLFGVSPHDPVILMGVTLLLIAVAVITAWIPARRAARIDPMEALRYE